MTDAATNPAAESESARLKAGLIYALSAYILWGLSPIYWRWFESAPLEIIAHRTIWAAVALAPFVWFRREALAFVLKSRARTLSTALAAVLIGANWGAFIWAVQNDHVLEASLGYYIGPLVNIAFGVIFMSERLNRRQAFAIALAAAGVMIPLIAQGRLPVVALFLAFSFSLYALVRKRSEVDGAAGLFLETAMLSPFALIGVIWFEASGTGRFLELSWQPVLLIFAGVVATAGILLLFILGARRLRLSQIGMLQFIAPTLQFFLGLAYGEAFPMSRAAAFAFIWAGLAFYVWDLVATSRKRRKAERAARTVVEPPAE